MNGWYRRDSLRPPECDAGQGGKRTTLTQRRSRRPEAATHSPRGTRLASSSSARPFPEEARMNWDRIEGNWKQLKGKAKVRWGKLTDDDLDVIAGKRDQLCGKLQEAYGVSKDEAERQIGEFGETITVDVVGQSSERNV
jgi:uncharacterized protein YjbJ (UPF0337 family)